MYTLILNNRKKNLELHWQSKRVKNTLWFARKCSPATGFTLRTGAVTDKLVLILAQVIHLTTKNTIDVKLCFTNCSHITESMQYRNEIKAKNNVTAFSKYQQYMHQQWISVARTARWHFFYSAQQWHCIDRWCWCYVANNYYSAVNGENSWEL